MPALTVCGTESLLLKYTPWPMATRITLSKAKLAIRDWWAPSGKSLPRTPFWSRMEDGSAVGAIVGFHIEKTPSWLSYPGATQAWSIQPMASCQLPPAASHSAMVTKLSVPLALPRQMLKCECQLSRFPVNAAGCSTPITAGGTRNAVPTRTRSGPCQPSASQ